MDDEFLHTSGLHFEATTPAARAAGVRTIVNSLDPPENCAPQDEFHPGRAALVLPELLQGLAREWGAG